MKKINKGKKKENTIGIVEKDFRVFTTESKL